MNALVISPFDIDERKKITRIIFTLILLLEIYLFFSNSFIHQFQQPVFKSLGLDLTYYGFHWIGIPNLIIRNPQIALIFDISLIALTVLCFLFPLKKIYLILFYLFFFTFFITVNSYSLFHKHTFMGVIFGVFPFLFTNNTTSKMLWEFTRYIHLFIYFSAFLWKVFRGSFFEFDHFQTIMESIFHSYLFESPTTFFAGVYRFLLIDPSILYILGLIGLFLEGIFLIGFFTKKYDRSLFLIGIILHISFWFFADAILSPLLILSLSLLNVRTVTKND